MSDEQVLAWSTAYRMALAASLRAISYQATSVGFANAMIQFEKALRTGQHPRTRERMEEHVISTAAGQANALLRERG